MMENINIDLSEVQDYLINLVPKAGQILRRYFHAETLATRKKGQLDFVTAADLAVDEFLRKELQTAYPKIPILTEEEAPKDFSKYVTSKLLWVVDPLDGTANFTRGDDNFSISIAFVSSGRPLVGVLFAPVSSRLFWARIDHDGAYWNGRRIHVSKVTDLKEAVFCTDWSHILSTRDQTTKVLRKIYGHVRQIKILGSAATDITLLARGGVDIYHHVHLMPWDVAAAALLAQKAGAKVTQPDGGEWNVFIPGILIANTVLHPKVLKMLKFSQKRE